MDWWSFRGRVEYCRELFGVEVPFGVELLRLVVAERGGVLGGIRQGSKATVTTESLTRSPDFRMKLTTCSWLA